MIKVRDATIMKWNNFWTKTLTHEECYVPPMEYFEQTFTSESNKLFVI
jgi:hypothetical protein